VSRIPSFKDLEVRRKAMALVRGGCDATRAYPAEERFGLIEETRKTVRSIPASIAGGKLRLSAPDFRKFVGITLGSAGELQTQPCMAADLGYLPATSFRRLETEVEEIARMLRGLERSLQAVRSPAPRPPSPGPLLPTA
jgi:four helix bundle protein